MKKKYLLVDPVHDCATRFAHAIERRHGYARAFADVVKPFRIG
jgi:hypothetical protein